ncbi:MAG: ABC transporter substrate-binding protein [Elainellaceae cyanobacterium]
MDRPIVFHWRYLRAIALSLLAFVIVTACGSNAVVSESGSLTPSDCRMVSHAMGETCVPNNPQRIVVLGGLDYALSLGVTPIGSDAVGPDEYYLKERVNGIADVGGTDAPSLEKILALKPDFILGGDYVNSSYNALSQIAPTVLISYDHSGEWKDFLMDYAEVLGKTAEAEQVMDGYYQRLEDFQQQMETRTTTIDVSIVRVYPTHINLYLKDSFCGTIVADAGLSRPPSQNFTASEANALFSNPIQYEISREKIPDIDGDVVFLWTYGHQDEIARQAQTQKEKLKSDPLWATLTAIQQDRVYEVPGYWIGDGPIAAHAVIDDLFKYFVETPQS